MCAATHRIGIAVRLGIVFLAVGAWHANAQDIARTQNTRSFGKLSLSLSLTLSTPEVALHPPASPIGSSDAHPVASNERAKSINELYAEIAAIEAQIKARQGLMENPAAILSSPLQTSSQPPSEIPTDLSTSVVPADSAQDAAMGSESVVASSSAGSENGMTEIAASTVPSDSTEDGKLIELAEIDGLDWAIALFALLLAVAGVFWYRRRKAMDTVEPYDMQGEIETPKAIESPQPDILVESDHGAEQQMAIPAWAEPPQKQKSLLPPEYEMLEEADIYLRFGHDKLAEEALREAIKINPKNPQAYLTLLRIYFSREDGAAFNMLAQQLKAIGDGSIWSRVAEMGRNLDADNPLYR